jgi:hypothetical protein
MTPAMPMTEAFTAMLIKPILFYNNIVPSRIKKLLEHGRWTIWIEEKGLRFSEQPA